jgi:hypothetical protein
VAFCSTHNEWEVQNFKLFVQTFHSLDYLDNKEVKQIYTLILLPPFLTYWVSILLLQSKHQRYVVALDLLIPSQLFVEVQIPNSFV